VFESGVVHLELYSGVQLVVEGEAEFSIESPLVVTLNKGAVRAYVPDVAHGFRVVTKAGKIIDYGTEFSVRVSGDTTDFTVLDGEVGSISAHPHTELCTVVDNFSRFCHYAKTMRNVRNISPYSALTQ
jgi:ferric-dicitrate binding protein FerR (iron transport regulator)